MRLTADLHIPFLKSSIEVYNSTATYGNEIEAEYIEPEEFTGERIAGADALIVRTRSRINKELLEGSRVRFVATATIGYDHIDTDYCHRKQCLLDILPGLQRPSRVRLCGRNIR